MLAKSSEAEEEEKLEGERYLVMLMQRDVVNLRLLQPFFKDFFRNKTWSFAQTALCNPLNY